MRILQVGTGFAPIPPTGAYATERVIYFLSSALMALGHQVTVLDIEEKNRPPVPYEVAEVPLHWYQDTGLPTHILRGCVFRQAVKSKLRQLLMRDSFDVVNFSNQFSAQHIPFVQKSGIPAVYSLHNPLWYNIGACHSRWQRLKFFQDIRAMRRADAVICLNKTISFNLARYLGIAENKIIVTPNGIADEWFAEVMVPEGLKHQYAPNNEQVILNVARIAPYKNQLTLARAIPLVANAIPRVRFIFAGPITDRGYYQQICHFLSDAGVMSYVSFVGEVPYFELPQLYSLSDVFVLPSAAEAMPLVILEAMAQGKPVVTSDIKPFSELLHEGIGKTVPVFDCEALANAIITLLKNKPLRDQMGRKAKEHVKPNYTWESVAKKTIEVYGTVIQRCMNRNTSNATKLFIS